jgi:hypothetical protein
MRPEAVATWWGYHDERIDECCMLIFFFMAQSACFATQERGRLSAREGIEACGTSLGSDKANFKVLWPGTASPVRSSFPLS